MLDSRFWIDAFHRTKIFECMIYGMPLIPLSNALAACVAPEHSQEIHAYGLMLMACITAIGLSGAVMQAAHDNSILGWRLSATWPPIILPLSVGLETPVMSGGSSVAEALLRSILGLF